MIVGLWTLYGAMIHSTCNMLNWFLRNLTYDCIFFHLRHRDGVGTWTPSSLNTMIHLSGIVNSTPDDRLVTQVAKSWTVMIFSWFSGTLRSRPAPRGSVLHEGKHIMQCHGRKTLFAILIRCLTKIKLKQCGLFFCFTITRYVFSFF